MADDDFLYTIESSDEEETPTNLSTKKAKKQALKKLAAKQKKARITDDGNGDSDSDMDVEAMDDSFEFGSTSLFNVGQTSTLSTPLNRIACQHSQRLSTVQPINPLKASQPYSQSTLSTPLNCTACQPC